MARYRTLGEYRFFTGGPEDDVRGSKLFGLGDEQIGTVVDVIFEQDSGCLLSVVVATSGSGGGRFVVPIEMIRSSFVHRNDCRVDLTREQVEQFPSYNDIETLSRMAREDDRSAWGDRDSKRSAKGAASSFSDVDTLATARPRADLSPISTDSPAGMSQSMAPNTDVYEEEIRDEETWVIGMGSRWLNLERQLRTLRAETNAVPIRKRARRGTDPPGGMRSKVS